MRFIAIFLLLILATPAAALDDDLYKWCVTNYIEHSNPPKPGHFESITAMEKVVSCSYYRGPGDGNNRLGEQKIPGGPDLGNRVDELSCTDLKSRISILELRLIQLELAMDSAFDALTVTVDAANRARVTESQFSAVWTRSRSTCANARINFQAAVDGTEKAKCQRMHGQARTDCLDTLYENLWNQAIGTALDVACTRESSDQTLWQATHNQTEALLATERQIRDDIAQNSRQQVNLASAILKARNSMKTCQ